MAKTPDSAFQAPAAAGAQRTWSFGPFRLISHRRLLLDGDRPIRLGSRALEILIALIERRGQLVSKQELIQIVWPDTHVVEANLTVHVAALRRALDDGPGGHQYIVNVPGRGYRFVADIGVQDEGPSKETQTVSAQPTNNIPLHLTRLVGRDRAVDELTDRIGEHRLISIVGPGGIGKTAVALELAERFMPNFADGVWLVDLVSLSDPHLVATAVASTLRIDTRVDDALPGLLAALANRTTLIVLDNCEHLIESIAFLVSRILNSSRGVKVLTTSREPLRIDGEQVYRLEPLPSPAHDPTLRAEEALSYPAVQLFVQRAAATMNGFELTDSDAADAADICRQLDGIPLAIEFAAARVDTFGIHGLAKRLDDRLRLLTSNNREPDPRHRTIQTALEWSYQLLSDDEQTLFRSLSVFAGGFTLNSAQEVAAGPGTNPMDIADGVASLVLKSLVTADLGDKEVRFRLLETTRAFALAKLEVAGERQNLSQRHASYFHDLLERKKIESNTEFAVTFGPEIGNVRSALAWAFSEGGNAGMAVALASSAAPLLFALSLLAECHTWTAKALELLPDNDKGGHRELVLQSLLGLSLMFTRGMSEQAREALLRANRLADETREPSYQLQAVAGLALFSIRLEKFREALSFAQQTEGIVRGSADPAALAVSDYILSAALFFVSRGVESLSYARRCNENISPKVRQIHLSTSGIDHVTQARCVIGGVLWQQGFFDQAVRMADEALSGAEALEHPVSICFALVWSVCPISLRLGNVDVTESAVKSLYRLTETHALTSYYYCALGFQGQIAARRGDLRTAEGLIRNSLEGLRVSQYEVLYTPFLSALALVVARSGRVEEGASLIEETVQRAERNDARWWMPEALRLKGEALLLRDQDDTKLPARLFERSINLAREQRMPAWELRSAMSLGRLLARERRREEAFELLQPVYAQFSEGFGTADLTMAAKHLDDWRR